MQDFDEDESWMIAQAEQYAEEPIHEEEEEMTAATISPMITQPTLFQQEETPQQQQQQQQQDDDEDDQWLEFAGQRDPPRDSENPIVSSVTSLSSKTNTDETFSDYFLRHPPLGKDTPITLENEDRRFIAHRSSLPKSSFLHSSVNLISSPINDLLIQIASKKHSTSLIQELPRHQEEKQTNRVPLVSRHAPTQFYELLSHERCNRDALTWLKTWDNFVFKQLKDSRPEQRILLLAGPPGAGKTTMAHVLAKHAGYRVVEINASDERTADVLKRRICDATEMQSVLQSNQLPNLLVLDEIDGLVDSSAVSVIIQLISNNSKHNTLNRPLICTCNDLYAPALKPLRLSPHTIVLQIRLPSESRLVHRLKDICKSEGIIERPGALAVLAKRMDCDIRACLNALDFWKGSSLNAVSQVLDVQAVSTLPAGEKDGEADLFETWRKVVKGEAPKELSNRLLRHFGDFDFCLEGVHENYPSSGYRDSTFTRTASAANWLAFADEMQHATSLDMDFEFQSYIPHAVVGLSRSTTFGNNVNKNCKVEFPNGQREFRRAHERSLSCMREFIDGIPRLSSVRQSNCLPLDVANSLTSICNPKVRPVPVGVMIRSERMDLQRAGEVMASVGLMYIRDKGEELLQQQNFSEQQPFQQMIVLDPPIDRLSKYIHLPPPPSLHTHGKLELAHEVHLHKLRLRSSSLATPDESSRKKAKTTTMTPRAPTTITGVPKPVITPSIRKDFFGRVITEEIVTQAISEEEKPVSLQRILFRFKEGFSEAVRRSVKMKEFVGGDEVDEAA